MGSGTTNRRAVLGLLAGLPLLAAGRSPVGESDAALIGRLIGEARAGVDGEGGVAWRIDSISRALLGKRYRANTLIGGPKRPEQFVVRADAFDCVTFCEVVLAAAIARDYDEFEATLRRLRYAHGTVSWAERNHYFAEWSRRTIENRVCYPVSMTPAVTIEKTVDWDSFGRRRVSMLAVSYATLRANRQLLASGDIIAFVSRQPRLDVFHTGFIIVPADGAPVLRHASESRGKVVDQRLDAFLAAYRVKYVMLLRAFDGEPTFPV